MEKKKLISFKTLFKEKHKLLPKVPMQWDAMKCINQLNKYSNFLEQNLDERYIINGFDAHPLNRFLPTDKEGNPLEEPRYYYSTEGEEFREAKQRVFFEGKYELNPKEDGIVLCDENKWIWLEHYQTIEGLLTLDFDLTLTETAIKLIGWENN